MPVHLKAEILREIDRLELVLRQINEVEAERDEMLRPGQESSPVGLLMRLKGIGPEFAAVPYLEGLFRRVHCPRSRTFRRLRVFYRETGDTTSRIRERNGVVETRRRRGHMLGPTVRRKLPAGGGSLERTRL